MIKNFVICGFLLILFYSLSLSGSVFGESNTTQYQFLNKFGEKGSEDGQMISPHSIDIDKDGNIYVTDTGNDRIQKYDNDGKFILQWGEEGTEDGQFDKLHDVYADPSGQYVYTLELKNHRVQKFTPDGKFILKWGFEDTGGQGAERTPHQLTVDYNGYVYLTDKNAHQILKFDGNGNFIEAYGSKGSTEGKFLEPHGIVFDRNNNMYVTDMKNSRVQVFDKDFNFKRQWGSFGNGTGQFSGTIPGIDLYKREKENLVFVVDKRSTNFQVFDDNGKFISKFGSKGKQDGQFNRPEDLAIDPEGKVFVADTGNSRIQIFGTR